MPVRAQRRGRGDEHEDARARVALEDGAKSRAADAITSFGGEATSDDDDAELGAPAPDAYKSKSGGIVDVLCVLEHNDQTALSLRGEAL